MSDRVRFTKKVKRGLALARWLLIDSFDPDATPSDRQVKRWRRPDQQDFNAAMAWLEQVEADQKPQAAEVAS